MGTDQFNVVSSGAKHRVAQRLDVPNCSVGQDDSELDGEVSSFAHCLLTIFADLVAILWMYPLLHHFGSRKAPLWIEAPDSKILLRPIERNSSILIDPTAGVGQPLRFR